jgi:hypothetical protein
MMMLGEPELAYLTRFFEGIDRAITEEMQKGVSLSEESLTFVLARLLDDKSTLQRVLDYSIDSLSKDLDLCGSGVQISVDFETNEHTKSFESNVSYADLGIVLTQEPSPLGPPLTKAIIVQSKKLYRRDDVYRIHSAYDAFNVRQYEGLKDLASTYGWGSIVYFLYNPKLDAFAEEDAKVLRAVEHLMWSPCFDWHRMWPEFYDTYEHYLGWNPEIAYALDRLFRSARFPWTWPTGQRQTSPDQMRAERARVTEQRPGLRVLDLRSIKSLVEADGQARGSFQLQECYAYALSPHRWRSSVTSPFLPLSSFMVGMFMGCVTGSDDEELIGIARGIPAEPKGESDTEPPGVAARHTITITVGSTLPRVDVAFYSI